MIKAFISHSSKQKEFVKELVDILGRNFCIVDCYDFEPAVKTINEIYKRIEQSSVFVLLLSKESLESDWVDKEIKYAKSKLAVEDYARFWPYIVDKDLKVEDCPDWIKTDQCFNLKTFKSPIMLARDIDQKFRRIVWDRDPKRKKVETLMVGRNSDIDDFESIFQSSRGLKLKSLVVSGRNGVGKDMFISQCLQKTGYAVETDPYTISLDNNEGVENFIIQLNAITKTYDEDALLKELGKSAKEKSIVATQLLNTVLESRSTISINDNLACVQANRHLSDWIVDVVENSGMNNQLGLFIKSSKVLHTFEDTNHPSFGHIMLKPLDSKDRTKLFYNLIRIYGIENITEADVQWFVDRLLLSPAQIVRAAEALSKQPVQRVKRDIDSLISWGDGQIKPFVSTFFGDAEKKNLLVILSKLDFVSYEILEKVFEERIIEIMEMLQEMMDFGVVTAFGPNEQYFRLDHYFSDYIKRCRVTLPTDLDILLNDVLEEKIANSNVITADTSVFLYDAKKRIMSGKACHNDFLIPSVVVTSVMEIYYRQDYQSVINVCRAVLNDIHNYYPEQERELRYWLCLALARKSDDSFFEEVKHLKDADHHFLRGFYHRIATDYSEAEKWLKKALEKNPNLQRAKRELVTVLLAQSKFDSALTMAQENYEKDPDNSYQIQGYFRCLVRKRVKNRDDHQMLAELMEAMKNNLSDKHEELYAAMNIEYQFYVKNLGVSDMIDVINVAESTFPGSINVKRAAQPFKLKQAMIIKAIDYPEDC